MEKEDLVPKLRTNSEEDEEKYKDYRPAIIFLSVTNIIIFALFIASGVVGMLTDVSSKLIYVQIVTTFIGFCLSITETFLMVYVVAKFAQDDRRHAKQGTNKVIRMLQTQLYDFDMRSGFMFFIGMLLLNTSLALVFWCISSIISYPTFGIRSYWHFRTMDIIIGYIIPILIMIGIIIILKVLQVITKYKFKPESIFASILVFVEYKTFHGNPWNIHTEMVDGKEQVCTEGFGAWTIAKFFHYPIIEVPDDVEEIQQISPRAAGIYKKMVAKNNNSNKISPANCVVCCCKFIYETNWASLCLAVILILNIILSLRLITNAIMIKEIEGKSLSCSVIEDNMMDCFEHTSHKYINCSAELQDNSTFNMECFRYYSPSEIDPLGALVRAIFLFISFEKFLQLLFGVVATLYTIRYHKVWAASVLVIGIIMIAFSITSLVFYDHLKTGFIFLSVFQFFILSIDVFLAGLLLVANKGYYKTKKGRLEMYPLWHIGSKVEPKKDEGDCM